MNKKDLGKILKKLKNEEILKEEEISNIIEKVIPLLKKEKKILKVREPLIVVGSLHGNFGDLLKIFNTVGNPSNLKYIFLGNYVDKGKNSLEVILYLIVLKIIFPEFIFLLRGGHESCSLNRIFGFYQEVIRKYQNDFVWKKITKIYEFLPIGCILKQSRSFCISGGLSPDIKFVKEIKMLETKNEILNESILADLLWGIPQKKKKNEDFGFAENGLGYYFPFAFTKRFLSQNNLLRIIRSKCKLEEGVEFFQENLVISIYSNTNDIYQNKAGFLILNENGDLQTHFFSKNRLDDTYHMKQLDIIFN